MLRTLLVFGLGYMVAKEFAGNQAESVVGTPSDTRPIRSEVIVDDADDGADITVDADDMDYLIRQDYGPI